MKYHCHHYLSNLQRTLFDADYYNSRGNKNYGE